MSLGSSRGRATRILSCVTPDYISALSFNIDPVPPPVLQSLCSVVVFMGMFTDELVVSTM